MVFLTLNSHLTACWAINKPAAVNGTFMTPVSILPICRTLDLVLTGCVAANVHNDAMETLQMRLLTFHD